MRKRIDLQALKNRYEIVGRDETLNEALETAIQVAPTDLSVLIQGESGVGKEVIPRIIHDYSKRKKNRYIAINCGSIPEGTIDSELFGHEKGAFTSAIGEHDGYFGAADGGTLFLDEVGELPLSTQARLLRVLETGEYLRVGSNTPRMTNARIIAATNINIPHAIREGKFREDLYYRLCTININLSPLRSRGSDVVLLFKKFALDIAQKYNIPEPIRLTPEAEEVVMQYKWPGNIRQLRNITEQLSILSVERMITPATLEKYGVVANSNTITSIATMSGFKENRNTHDYDKEIKLLAHAVFELRNEVNELKQQVQKRVGAQDNTNPSTLTVPQSTRPAIIEHTHLLSSPKSNVMPRPDLKHADMEFQTAEAIVEDDTLNISETEKRNIIKALERNHYKRQQTAKELGISTRTLYRKLKSYGID